MKIDFGAALIRSNIGNKEKIMKVKTNDRSEIDVYVSDDGLECCLMGCAHLLDHANACSKFNRQLFISRRFEGYKLICAHRCRANECVEQYGTLSDILQLKPALPPALTIQSQAPIKGEKND